MNESEYYAGEFTDTDLNDGLLCFQFFDQKKRQSGQNR
jgi:hypothetical protein